MRGPIPWLLAAALLGACGGGRGSGMAGMPGMSPTPARAQSTASAKAPPPSPADVKFMTMMIPHHAQAVLIAGWAETHGASPSVKTLCERIVVGQRDEIALMQSWLRDHGQPVPAGEDPHTHMAPMAGMAMSGMDMGHEMMPGMLNEDELAKLDAARGQEWDRLFMTYMIGHHQGAILMVNELLASQDAANDNTVYKMASDIYADQNIEIERMRQMLAAIP
jgi:uncharacterized protein (DUF305 family)